MDKLPLSLPRTTAQQNAHGTGAAKHGFKSGDHVFFLMTKMRGMSVYIGDAKFVHASSSQGHDLQPQTL
ncbi:NlpC/P60 family protein [Enterobacter ludwigii]|uniref:NlpC/P60 family protein n=1 Tax=Enterobacter ludwigii TaxID=299767 RepID=UPI003975C647